MQPAPHVCVIGAGPVGLAFALCLAEQAPAAGIRVMDKRLCGSGSRMSWAGNGRREHVLTIQSRQYMKLPASVRDALLLSAVPVWPLGPDSVENLPPVNISIRECEDILLRLALEHPRIDIGASDVGLAELEAQAQWADMIVAADGAHSLTAAWMAPQLPDPDSRVFSHSGEEWVDWCLGIAASSRQSTATSVALTVAQNRYLLNPLPTGGFVNMRLAPSEAQAARGMSSKGGSINLRALDGTGVGEALREGLVWFDASSDGVSAQLFSLKSSTRSRYTARLRCAGAERGPLYGAVIGDAAVRFHVWPGRGYNCGLAGAISLARALSAPRTRASLREADLSKHEGAMAMLAHRHTTRAWRATVADSGAGELPYALLIEASLRQCERESDRLDLAQRAHGIAERLHGRLLTCVRSEQIDEAVERLDSASVRTLVHSRAWNSEGMGGAEAEIDHLA